MMSKTWMFVSCGSKRINMLNIDIGFAKLFVDMWQVIVLAHVLWKGLVSKYGECVLLLP